MSELRVRVCVWVCMSMNGFIFMLSEGDRETLAISHKYFCGFGISVVPNAITIYNHCHNCKVLFLLCFVKVVSALIGLKDC